MALEKIRGKVWADTSGTNGGNIGAVKLRNEVVVIDTGMYHTLTSETKKFITSNLGENITQVFLTHHHPDHVFGAQAFDQADIVSSAITRDTCAEKAKAEWTKERLLERVRDDNDDVLFRKNIESLKVRIPNIVYERVYKKNVFVTAVLMGGHTAGSSIVVIEPEHVVFTGDLLFTNAFPYGGDPTCNPERWIEFLKFLSSSLYIMFIPGHGPTGDIDTAKNLLNIFQRLKDRVLTAIEKNWSAEELIDRGEIPDYFNEGYEQRILETVRHWIDFYKSHE